MCASFACSQAKLLAGKRREYRVAIAASNVREHKAMDAQLANVFDSSKWSLMPVDQRSTGLSFYVFRMASRYCLSMNELSVRRHEAWPVRIFGSLDNDSVIDELVAESKCMLDNSMKLHLRQYPTAAALRSRDATEIRKFLAAEIEHETSRLENKFSSVARCKVLGSVMPSELTCTTVFLSGVFAAWSKANHVTVTS